MRVCRTCKFFQTMQVQLTARHGQMRCAAASLAGEVAALLCLVSRWSGLWAGWSGESISISSGGVAICGQEAESLCAEQDVSQMDTTISTTTTTR